MPGLCPLGVQERVFPDYARRSSTLAHSQSAKKGSWTFTVPRGTAVRAPQFQACEGDLAIFSMTKGNPESNSANSTHDRNVGTEKHAFDRSAAFRSVMSVPSVPVS
jgi:hypothetical protein